MSSPSLRLLLVAFFVVSLASVDAKPSHPLALHGIPDHVDALPPLISPAHFHASVPLPPATFFSVPAPALPPPLPLPLAAPAPAFAPAPLPAPALFNAPAALPAPVFAPAPLPALPLATKVFPPVLEAVPFAVSAPTYRAIPGLKTTTHHISVGYAFPTPLHAAKLTAQSPLLHSHITAAPLATAPHHHHFHHSLF